MGVFLSLLVWIGDDDALTEQVGGGGEGRGRRKEARKEDRKTTDGMEQQLLGWAGLALGLGLGRDQD